MIPGMSGERSRPMVLAQASLPTRRWLAFDRPRAVLEARRVEEVAEVVRRAAAAAEDGIWAAGFLAYEAAPAFDPAFVTRPPGALPLAWFGLFDESREVALDELPPGGALRLGEWTPALDAEAYARRVATIRRAIARGDTYQVNLTFPLRSSYAGDPWSLFRRLAVPPSPGHRAWVDLGGHQICSLSPELFFALDGDRVTARPMKGTARRGPTTAGDLAQRRWLAGSPKDRAENLMIVDMLRNDLGRVAEARSVATPRLFDVERYPTVFQMTSTVEARTRRGVPEILAALFPCASITGAPKVRTMELIAGLEDGPRGIYTGAIGYLGPGRRAELNVAIRTIHFDRDRGIAEYGTGGGVTWDSVAEDEYEECRVKSLAVTAPPGPAGLFETLLWDPANGGYWLLERHLDRLIDSAAYFEIPCGRQEAAAVLERCAATLERRRSRVRLDLSSRGTLSAFATVLDAERRPWRVALAEPAVDAGEPLLHHKTTSRGIYEAARDRARGADDVLLRNRAGELTEATRANLVLRKGDRWLTPAAACGLLPGTFRAELLARGLLEEARLKREDLETADEVWLINSLRGWIPIELVGVAATAAPSETPSPPWAAATPRPRTAPTRATAAGRSTR